MEETIIKSTAKEKLLHTLPAAKYDDVQAFAARLALHEFELPTSRTEDWKYTRTTRISNTAWTLTTEHANVDVAQYEIAGLDAAKLIFVDGIFRQELSDLNALPSGISVVQNVISNEENIAFTDFYDAYQAALTTDKIRIHAESKSASQKSIHIIHIAATALSLIQPQIEIDVDVSASLHIVESFVSCNEHATFTNRKLNVKVGANASLHIDKIQMETSENFMINNEQIHIAQDGRFTINTLTIECNWVRNQLNIALDGKNIEANLHGFYLPTKKQFVDNHTRVEHLQPHCVSNELYKGMLNDSSVGVFNGKVYVHLDAQKTNAFQSNANILLSDDAQMNTKPELEIYADDVKCSHGTTTGQLDEEALFYLKSRGIAEDNARKLLANAFISDVLEKVTHDKVREYVMDQLIQRDLLFA